MDLTFDGREKRRSICAPNDGLRCRWIDFVFVFQEQEIFVDRIAEEWAECFGFYCFSAVYSRCIYLIIWRSDVAGLDTSGDGVSIVGHNDFYLTPTNKIKTDYIVAVPLSTI